MELKENLGNTDINTNESPKTDYWFLIKFWGAVILGVIFLVSRCDFSSDEVEQPDNKVRSIMYTEKYIEEIIKSPSTADFGTPEVTRIGSDTYHVKNYVDSENSFGAMIRMKYECDIKWSGNDYTIENVVTD